MKMFLVIKCPGLVTVMWLNKTIRYTSREKTPKHHLALKYSLDRKISMTSVELLS